MRPSHTTQVTPTMVERTLQVTDTFFLDRDSCVVPLQSHLQQGSVFVLPDGKLLLHPPVDQQGFDVWVAELPARLASLDLRKTRRAS